MFSHSSIYLSANIFITSTFCGKKACFYIWPKNATDRYSNGNLQDTSLFNP